MAHSKKYQLAVLSHQGMVRTNNEDAFSAVIPGMNRGYLMRESEFINLNETFDANKTFERIVFSVADGMGGTNAGEVASGIAVETINKVFLSSSPSFLTRDILFNAIIQANKDIITHGYQHPQSLGMGTTCVIAAVEKTHVHIAWVGDSRAYLYNPETGLTQLSKDHSLVQELVDMKQISAEAAFYHPDSNIITQSLGDPDRVVTPGFMSMEINDEDILLLCSDGLNSMLQDLKIAAILQENYDLDNLKIAEHLITAANDDGGQDNITVAVFRWKKGEDTDLQPESTGKESVPPLNPDVRGYPVNQLPNSRGPKPRKRRILQKLMLWLIGLLITAGLIWNQVRESARTEAKLQLEIFLRDSIQKAIADSLSRQLTADSIKLTQLRDSLDFRSLLRITSNSTNQNSAFLLNDQLKNAGFKTECSCDTQPYRVYIKLRTGTNVDSFRSVFIDKHRSLIDSFQLVPKNFEIIQK